MTQKGFLDISSSFCIELSFMRCIRIMGYRALNEPEDLIYSKYTKANYKANYNAEV